VDVEVDPAIDHNSDLPERREYISKYLLAVCSMMSGGRGGGTDFRSQGLRSR
jgi:hypothetical protein